MVIRAFGPCCIVPQVWPLSFGLIKEQVCHIFAAPVYLGLHGHNARAQNLYPPGGWSEYTTWLMIGPRRVVDENNNYQGLLWFKGISRFLENLVPYKYFLYSALHTILEGKSSTQISLYNSFCFTYDIRHSLVQCRRMGSIKGRFWKSSHTR